MSAPVDLAPAATNSFDSTVVVNTTDDAIQARALEVASTLSQIYPSRVMTFDIWHSAQSKQAHMPAQTSWFRVAENVEIVFSRQHDRWYQDKVGILHNMVERAVLPIGLQTTSEDRLIESQTNKNYMVIDVTNQSGIECAMLKQDIHRFSYPPQAKGTYRLLRISCQTG